MPFKSEKQRRWMHIHNPKLAHKWEHEYKKEKKEHKNIPEKYLRQIVKDHMKRK